MASAQNTHNQPNAVCEAVAPHTPTAATTPNLPIFSKFLGFLAQVFGIFGSGIAPKTWCRNCTKNLAKRMELMPKLGAEINSKCDCRKLVHCGAPIQNLHGPIFWSNFWTTFLDQVLDQVFGPVLDQVFGPIPEPKFPEN